MIGGSPPVSFLQLEPPSVDLKMPPSVPPNAPFSIESLLLLPQRGVDGVGIAGIDANIVAAGVFVLVEHLLERSRRRRWSGRCRAPDWARRDGPAPRRTAGSGFVRIDFDIGDHLRIAQAQVRPGLAGVGGFVHAVASGQIGADDAGAGADIDHVGIGGRHGDGADGAGRLVIEQRNPGGAEVGGAPDAAVVEADIEDVGLAGHAGKRARASGAGRPDGSPVHLGIESAVDVLSRRERGQEKRDR